MTGQRMPRGLQVQTMGENGQPRFVKKGKSIQQGIQWLGRLVLGKAKMGVPPADEENR